MSAVVVTAVDQKFDTQVPLIIVGAGAAGLCAALAAKEAGIDAVVIERDDVPSGSTALSAGLIPAAGTRFQRDKGIADSPDSVRRRHPAQGERRGGSCRRRDRGGRRGASRRVACGPLRPAFRRHRQLQLSRPFSHAHARPSEPYRPRVDRSAAQCRRSERHRHSRKKHGPTPVCRFRKPHPRRRSRSPRRQLRAHRLRRR